MNIHIALFLSFAKVGALTFGGGYAMLPLLEREVVDRRGWVTLPELTDIFAIGQCTPGIIAVDTAAMVGYRKGGTWGGIAAVLGITFPSVALICVIAGLLNQMAESVWVSKALAGIRAGICALILSVVLRLVRESAVGTLPAVIFGAVLIGAAFLGLSPALLVVAAGLIGYLRSVWGRRGS